VESVFGVHRVYARPRTLVSSALHLQHVRMLTRTRAVQVVGFCRKTPHDQRDNLFQTAPKQSRDLHAANNFIFTCKHVKEHGHRQNSLR
jgi:hypothetical protein